MPRRPFESHYRLYLNGPMAAGGSEITFTDMTHAHSGREYPTGLSRDRELAGPRRADDLTVNCAMVGRLLNP